MLTLCCWCCAFICHPRSCLPTARVSPGHSFSHCPPGPKASTWCLTLGVPSMAPLFYLVPIGIGLMVWPHQHRAQACCADRAQRRCNKPELLGKATGDLLLYTGPCSQTWKSATRSPLLHFSWVNYVQAKQLFRPDGLNPDRWLWLVMEDSPGRKRSASL